MVDRLGVSRSPVREVLRRLEVAGLVDVLPVNGRRVLTTFGVEDIEGLYTMRAALEALAFERAARRLSAADLDLLERTQRQMDAQGTDGALRSFDLDFEYHRIVARAAGLARLERTLEDLWLQTHALLRQLDAAGIYPGDREEVDESYADHRRLLDALRERDASRAARLVVAHLHERRDALIREVVKRGGIV